MDFIETCRRFIGIDSTPSHGSLEIAKYAAELCHQAGLSVELQTETLNGIEQANVIARPSPGQPEREFMLQTHLDTVDPGAYSLWTKTGANPFNASIYQRTMYGLGAADVKLDFLCKLKAVVDLHDSGPWKLPFVLTGTYGEELGMAGAVRLVRKKKIKPVMALVGEPTNMSLIYASKGIAHVEITVPFSDEELKYHHEHNLNESTSTQSRIFRGKSAHSSTPHLGENAIVKMLRYLSQLPSGLVVMGLDGGANFNTVAADAVLEIDMVGTIRNNINSKLSAIIKAIDDLELEFSLYPEEGFSPPGPTLNIGMIRTFEDHVTMSGNFRWPPCVSNEIYEVWMGRLREVCARVGAAFHIREYKEPFSAHLEGTLVQGCRAELTGLGLDGECRKHSVCNEANVFSRFGIESVMIGPGVSEGNSHTPDEHVHLDQLELAVAFYRNAIKRFCL